MWTNSRDLLTAIHDTHARVKAKEIEADQAHAEARLLASATRLLDTTLEHARLTNQLKDGSAELPDIVFTAGVIPDGAERGVIRCRMRGGEGVGDDDHA